MGRIVARPGRRDPMSLDEYRMKRQRMEFLLVESARRRVELEPMYYGMPDIMFPRGFAEGEFDLKQLKVVREPLPYEETEQQYRDRQDHALYILVTEQLHVVKDDRFVKIKLMPKMVRLLADLIYHRMDKVILWANRGGGKSLLAAVFMWLSIVYRKKSFLNMGGAGNQARRVYDYTTQFWHCFPGMQKGFLVRDPLLQRTELKNGTKLVCATSGTTAIGEHVPGFVADEASLLPSYQLLTAAGISSIADIVAGESVLGREGNYQTVLEQFSHPYDGRILRLIPYGNGLEGWVTEEHRVWAIKTDGVSRREGRVLPDAADCAGLVPEWIRAFDLEKGDILCYPRFHKKSGTFELRLGNRILTGPDFWRFLGYWAGDGGAPKGTRGAYPVKLHLSEAKERFLDDAEALLASVSSGSVNRSQPPSRGPAIDLVASSDQVLWSVLRNDVGLGEERGFPLEWFELATDDELRNWLRGYLRTDGNSELSNSGALSAWCVTTTAEGLALNVIYAFNRLGIPYYVTRRPSTRYGVESLPRWDFKIRAGCVTQILEDIDLAGFRLPREQAVKSWSDDDWCYTLIRKIEDDHYEGQVYDLKMDGDPSFGAPAFAMLHNCTERPGADETLMRAMQGALSEPNHQIFLLSTFHLPVGFFADMWDNAEEQGFTRVRWGCYDTMSPCTAGLEEATEDDPKARAFCFSKCSLTRTEGTYDEFGRLSGQQWTGCMGRARHSTGWQTRRTVLDEQRMNLGTRIFEVEHECNRPNREGQIYNRSLIEKCVVQSSNLALDRKKTIGIDWGLTECAMILLCEWTEENPEEPDFPREGMCVVDVVYMSGRLVDSVVEQIERWVSDFGDPEKDGSDFRVRADGSHPYNNKEITNYGYVLKQVHGDKGFMGTDNTARWIGSGYLRILDGNELFVRQLHNLRRNIMTGKQVKKNIKGDEGDHGPDALRFALMDYDFIKWMNLQKKKRQKTVKERKKPKRRLSMAKPLDGLLR